MAITSIVLFFLTIFSLISTVNARSYLRPDYADIPRIETRWKDSSIIYSLKSWHLEEEPLFKKFNKDYFFAHLLPEGPIPLRRDPKKTVEGAQLIALADELMMEIAQRKRQYTHFKILKKRDFNRATCSGLLILKYKAYDFVLKLFLETPETYVRPFSKGWQPGCFFILGGGINRYLSGFTRVKNLEAIEELVAQDPFWCDKIDFPRKWYLLPRKVRWFMVTGYNIGRHQSPITIELPAIYGVIADAIDGKPLEFSCKQDRRLGIRLSRVLTNRIDPNIDNFMIENGKKPARVPKQSKKKQRKKAALKRTRATRPRKQEKPKDEYEHVTNLVNKYGKIVLIDTEHFPTMIGLKKPLEFDGYLEWYTKIAGKYVKDGFFRTKKERLAAVRSPTAQWLPV